MSELRKYQRLQLVRNVLRRGLTAFVLVLFVVVGTGCITVDLLSGGGPESQLVETVIRGDEGPKILLVEIDGIIGGSNGVGSLFGGDAYSMVARVREVLDLARNDSEVRALLLRIDSPGGTATASEQIYTEIQRFRDDNLYPAVEPPVFSQHGGPTALGFSLTMTNPNAAGTIRFTTDGSDPRLTGGAVSGTAQLYTVAIPIDVATTVMARVLDGVSWSALTAARAPWPAVVRASTPRIFTIGFLIIIVHLINRLP